MNQAGISGAHLNWIFMPWVPQGGSHIMRYQYHGAYDMPSDLPPKGGFLGYELGYPYAMKLND